MDFQSLPRRDLQTLCKKNSIPANMTNVAMADALAALSHVEGLGELLNNHHVSETSLGGKKDVCETPLVRRTATRTSTRRKPSEMEQKEPQSSILQSATRTCRGMRNPVAQNTDEEEEEEEEEGNINVNLHLETPAAAQTTQWPRAQARTGVQNRKNKAQPPPAAAGQRVYSTRRSVRLLENTMAELTLTEKEPVEPIDVEKSTKDELATTTKKETLKPIKMEELYLEEEIKANGISDQVGENKDKEEEAGAKTSLAGGRPVEVDFSDVIIASQKSSAIPENGIKWEMVDVLDEPDLAEVREFILEDEPEENKDDITTNEAGPVTMLAEYIEKIDNNSDASSDKNSSGTPESEMGLEDNMKEEVTSYGESCAANDEKHYCIHDENITFGESCEKDFSLKNESSDEEGDAVSFIDDDIAAAEGQVLVEKDLASYEKLEEEEAEEFWRRKQKVLEEEALVEANKGFQYTDAKLPKEETEFEVFTNLVDVVNKENFDANANAVKVLHKSTKNNEEKSLTDMSLRGLTKLLKEKLVIKNERSDEAPNQPF